jgi:nitroreductase
MNETYDFIKGLRALRDYRPDPITEADLEAILEAARWTGSSKNRQDWSFVVVNDPERLEGLAEHGDYTQPVRDSATTIVLIQESGGNMFDIGRAAQNMMLAAEAIGVATCPISLHRDEDARVFLGAPEGVITRYAIAMGYPTESAAPRNFGGRKASENLVRYDTN